MPSHYQEELTKFSELANRRPDLFTKEQKERITSNLKLRDFEAELERKFQQQKTSAPTSQPS